MALNNLLGRGAHALLSIACKDTAEPTLARLYKQLLEVFGGNLCRLRLLGIGGEEVLLAAASSSKKVVQCHC